MKPSMLFGLDAAVHLLFGIGLMFFPRILIGALGIPPPDTAFYASVLGAVLAGLGLALLAERFRRVFGISGLGFGGAICIKICTGGVLIAWLMRGGLPIPLHGYVLLWLVTFVLLALSGAEFWVELKQNRDDADRRGGVVP
ncbi:MAG: hypothetical protein ACYDHM_04350 [Acidiferrobacterales bacterium]